MEEEDGEETEEGEGMEREGTGWASALQLCTCPVCGLVYVRLDRARAPWEEGTSGQELLVSDWPADKFVQHFLD